MITVCVHTLPEDDCIVRIVVSGHAQYAPHGTDIVCAAVSAVSFGAVHAIASLAHVEMIVDIGERGFMDASCTPHEARMHDVQLLLRSMEAMMQLIAHHYPKHVRVVRQRQVKEGGETS